MTTRPCLAVCSTGRSRATTTAATSRASIDHLPYLKDLGATALWINPVYDNVNHLNQRERYHNEGITDYHGYGAVDFYGVEEHFGTLAKFRATGGRRAPRRASR